ncbi:hypothetical protein ABIC83_002635 [Roseateles asaccharophilus]|uniref:hypothetical protein n=1 Tax=Roseateles asaccharophilus TaxID=582607 RepID=UPI0038325AC3
MRSFLPVAMASAMALVAIVARAEDGDDQALRQTISESEGAIRAEVMKAATINKAVAEGLAAYRQQTILQTSAAKLKEDLTQPDAMCSILDSQDAVNGGSSAARAGALRGQSLVRKPFSANENTLVTMQASYAATNARFCLAEEEAQGICKVSTTGQYANLTGADQNALFLFQSRSGGDTYEGKHDGAQVEAVNAYITRVVYGSMPPEQLRRDKGQFQKSPQARAYAELQRRYSAFLSMSAYSLNRIKESRNPKQ